MLNISVWNVGGQAVGVKAEEGGVGRRDFNAKGLRQEAHPNLGVALMAELSGVWSAGKQILPV